MSAVGGRVRPAGGDGAGGTGSGLRAGPPTGHFLRASLAAIGPPGSRAVKVAGTLRDMAQNNSGCYYGTHLRRVADIIDPPKERVVDRDEPKKSPGPTGGGGGRGAAQSRESENGPEGKQISRLHLRAQGVAGKIRTAAEGLRYLDKLPSSDKKFGAVVAMFLEQKFSRTTAEDADLSGLPRSVSAVARRSDTYSPSFLNISGVSSVLSELQHLVCCFQRSITIKVADAASREGYLSFDDLCSDLREFPFSTEGPSDRIEVEGTNLAGFPDGYNVEWEYHLCVTCSQRASPINV